MKILITGITGLFGSYLAKEFFGIGEVHGLKRKESDTRLLSEITDAIHWHEGDVNDYESLETAFEGMDLVIHSAGLVSFDSRDEERLLKVNTEGTQNVVNVMLDKGIKKLLHVSSVGALGRAPGILSVNEKSKWTSHPLNTPYAVSKYLAELEVWRAAQEGLDAMVFNPSVLLGKISDNRSSTGIYGYVLNENKYFPKGNINYLDVRDAARLVQLLYHNGNWNERYILNRESMPFQSFFGLMATLFKKKAPYRPVQDSMTGLAVIMVRLQNLLRKSKSPLSLQTARTAQQRIVFENQKVNSLLDFQYRSLEETFKWAMGTKVGEY